MCVCARERVCDHFLNNSQHSPTTVRLYSERRTSDLMLFILKMTVPEKKRGINECHKRDIYRTSSANFWNLNAYYFFGVSVLIANDAFYASLYRHNGFGKKINLRVK